MTLGILGAMAEETDALIAAMQTPAVTPVAGTEFYHGTLEGQPVVIARCGIGKVAAAIGAQILIDLFAVDGIVNTGVAGGLLPSLAIGDLVIADAAVQHDFDLTTFGHVRGFLPAMGGDDRQPSRFPTDLALSAAFREAADAVRGENGDFSCHGGIVVSGDVFVDNGELKQSLRQEFHATAAEMEGAAIAQVAYQNGVPFALVRAISDLAEGGATANFEQFVTHAAARSTVILRTMLRRMSR